MSWRDEVIYRRPVGRLALEPLVDRGYEAFRATGATPSYAYSAFRKLYGNDDAELFAALVRATEAERPLLDLPPDPAGLVAGSVAPLVESLRRDGFAVLDHLLDESVQAELIRVAEAARCTLIDANVGAPDQAVFDPAAPQAIRYEVPEADLVAAPAVQRLLADESLLAVAQEYFGAAPVQDLVAMWWSAAVGRPPSSAAAQQYHFDLDRPRFLKLFVYLSDVDDRSGPHTYVRGSHASKPDRLRHDGRHTDAEVEAAYPGEAQRLAGPRGTMFLADTIGLHKGTEVLAGHRLVFQLEWCTSLFGAPFSRPALRDPVPELVAAAGRHPDTFTRFDLGGS